MMEIKEEDFLYDMFYNEVEWSLKITHTPTGLFESSGTKSSGTSHYLVRKELLSKLKERIKNLEN